MTARERVERERLVGLSAAYGALQRSDANERVAQLVAQLVADIEDAIADLCQRRCNNMRLNMLVAPRS